MAITYDSLRQFARENGDIRLYAPEKAEVIILKDGTSNLFDVIAHATTFYFKGKEYTRAQFDDLLSSAKRKLNH
jgi:hypothetical protein